MKYIVAFNGARDHYEVPLALAEHLKLKRLVTDFYMFDQMRGRSFLPSRLQGRRVDGIPSASVTSCLDVFLAQHLLRPLVRPGALFHWLDQRIGRRAAMQLDSSQETALLIYSGYALEAFEKAGATRLKCLFFYQPHNSLARAILAEDARQFPRFSRFESADPEFQSVALEHRNNRELKLADHVICASEFTKRSLVSAGVPADKITVVPYGCNPAATHLEANREKRFLFVGQGVQWKGLHHLFKAWDSVRLRGARLDVVCSLFDRRIELPTSANVYVHRHLGKEEVNKLFQAASIFVMPSLVEGFGLVYLEALSAGCICIGTYNSGLPDLNLGNAAIVVQPGSTSALEGALVDADLAFSRGIDHLEVASRARARSWETFRETLILKLGGIERQSKLYREGCRAGTP